MATPGPRQRGSSGRGAELVAPDGSRVRVHAFPTDASLMRDVVRLWQRLAPDRADTRTFRRDLEAELHRWYPLLSIQVQGDLASVDHEPVWYVFRDGRVRTPRPVRDDFYTALSEARAVQETLDQTIRSARQTVELANRPRGPRATRSAGSTERPPEPRATPTD